MRGQALLLHRGVSVSSSVPRKRYRYLHSYSFIQHVRREALDDACSLERHTDQAYTQAVL